MTTPPVVSGFPVDAPSQQDPANFSNRMDAYLAAMQPNIDTQNALATWINLTASAVDASLADTLLSSEQSLHSSIIAMASAGLKGDWINLTGSAEPPYSVIHNHRFWALRTAITDITADEPLSDDGNWIEIPLQVTVPIPIVIAPIDSNNESISPNLAAGPYQHLYNEPRTARRFQVDIENGDFSAPIYQAAVDSDEHIINTTLDPSENYKWRCRDESATAVSNWTLSKDFRTAASFIYAPTGVTVGGSLDYAPVISVNEEFLVFNGTDTHQSTDLVVERNGAVIFESLNNTDDLYNISVPKGVLEESTEYTFKVSFKGNTISNSEYGEVVFTTNDEFDIRDLWAVAPQSSPYLKIFQQDVDSLNLLDSVSDITTHSSPQRNDNIAFSKRGTYVAKVLNSAPFLQTYKRDRAEFTILPEIPGDALGYVNGVVFVGDSSEYMIVGHSTAPYLAIFRIDNGVFTRMPDLNDMPATAVSSLTTNIKGDHFALIAGSNVSVYSVTGDTFSSFPENIAHSTIADIAISQDGTYMIVIASSGTHVNVYKKTNGVYSLIPSSVSNSDNNGIGEWVLTCALSDDANYLAIGHRYQSSTTDFLTLFKRDQDNFIRLPNPSAVPSHNVWDMVFSDDSGYLGISTHTGGFLYKIDGDTFTKIEASSTALGYGYGIAYCNTGE